MNKSFRYLVCAIAAGAILGWAMPALANDDGAVLKQADDVLKQAWNPGGDPPGADERTQLLTKAIHLTISEEDHRLRGQRAKAIQLMKQAVDLIKAGDPDNKVYGLLKDADGALREAIELAEGH